MQVTLNACVEFIVSRFEYESADNSWISFHFKIHRFTNESRKCSDAEIKIMIQCFVDWNGGSNGSIHDSFNIVVLKIERFSDIAHHKFSSLMKDKIKE